MLGLLFTATAGASLAFYFVPAVCLLAVISFAFNKGKNKTELTIGLMCIAVGILSYSFAYREQVVPAKQLISHTAKLTATVTEKPYCRNGRYYYTVKTKEITVTDTEITDIPKSIKLRLSASESWECDVYEDVELQVKFKESNKSRFSKHNIACGFYIDATPDEDSVKALGSETRPWYSFVYSIRENVYHKLLSVLDKDSSSLLMALLLGDKSSMDRAIQEGFREAGLSHLIVVSGLHLSIISGFIFKVFSCFIKDKKIPAGITIAMILIYAVITGFAYSVIRSAVMNIIWLGSYFVHRKPSSINSLGLAGLIITGVNPLSISNLSFILSFLATLGIITLESKIRKGIFALLPHRASNKRLWYINKPAEYVAGCISVSTSATLFTLPIAVFVFESFNTYFLLSNLAVLALAPAVIVLGIFLTAVLYIPFALPLAETLAIIEKCLCGILLYVSECVSQLPMAVISLGSFTIKLGMIAVIAIVAVFFVVQGFRVKSVGICTVVCICGYTIIMSLGYLVASNFMVLQIIDTGGGVAVVDTSPGGVSVLSCGGDRYHTDNAVTALENKIPDTMVIPDYRMYYSKYAQDYICGFDFKNILIYDTDKYSEGMNELLQSKNVKYIDENTRVDFQKYSYEIITVKDEKGKQYRNWIYIQSDSSTVLISPENADCSKLPQQYRKCDVLILQRNCSNVDSIACGNTVHCGKNNANKNTGENYYYTENGDVLLYEIFNRSVSVWQS